ncbi:MAG: hypothetical protein HQL79_10915 [Magnetococcales bacterium]|nr:hypothetical protein [Magnetococcales bacterium]
MDTLDTLDTLATLATLDTLATLATLVTLAIMVTLFPHTLFFFFTKCYCEGLRRLPRKGMRVAPGRLRPETSWKMVMKTFPALSGGRMSPSTVLWEGGMGEAGPTGSTMRTIVSSCQSDVSIAWWCSPAREEGVIPTSLLELLDK